MRRLLLSIAVLSVFACVSTSFADSGQSPRELRKLARKGVSSKALSSVCPRISEFTTGALYKNPGSDHLPSNERDTLTLIFRRGDSRIPSSNTVYAYDSGGNQVSRLGAKFPNGTYGKRYYTKPTGDGKSARQVQNKAVANTGSTVVYFAVRGTCLRAPSLVNVRLGGGV